MQTVHNLQLDSAGTDSLPKGGFLQGKPNLQYFQIIWPGSRTDTPPYQCNGGGPRTNRGFILNFRELPVKKTWIRSLLFFSKCTYGTCVSFVFRRRCRPPRIRAGFRSAWRRLRRPSRNRRWCGRPPPALRWRRSAAPPAGGPPPPPSFSARN